MSITIDLPEEFLAEAFHVPPAEVPRQLRIELACVLYARGAMTHAQAATFTALDRFGFDEELARRDLPRHYSQADVAADLAYGRGQ